MLITKIIITAPFIIATDGRLIRQQRILKQAGFDVVFLAPEEYEAKRNPDVIYFNYENNLLVKTAKIFPVFLSRFIRHRIRNYYWKKALAAQKADIIITSEPEGLIACTGLSTDGCKIIYDAHEFYDDETSDAGRNSWAAKTHYKFIKKADGFITVSENIAQLYTQKYPEIKKPHIFVNVSGFEKVKYDFRLHDALGVSRDRKIILFHGNMCHGRALEFFPEISENLDDNYALVVMGYGEFADFIKQSVSDRLFYCEPVPYDELPYWISGASLGLVLYRPDNSNQENCSPNKVFEFANLGIQILTYDVAGMRYLKQRLANINLVKKNASAKEISSEINRIIKKDKAEQETVMLEYYTISYQAKAFVDYIKSFVKK